MARTVFLSKGNFSQCLTGYSSGDKIKLLLSHKLRGHARGINPQGKPVITAGRSYIANLSLTGAVHHAPSSN